MCTARLVPLVIISYVTHKWSAALREYGETFVTALDISRLLIGYGIKHSPLCFLHLSDHIFCFLTGRTISIVVDSVTDPSGVPNGSVLSLTLSLLFISVWRVNLIQYFCMLIIPLCIHPFISTITLQQLQKPVCSRLPH